jgi:hypothetical protein
MARYQRSYAGERRTEFVGIWMTPTERVELEAAAEQQGATLSQFSREMLFRRAAAVVAATRRNPEAAGLKRELHAIGNNVNQIAYQLNATGRLHRARDLDEIMELLKRAIRRVLDL